MSPLVSLASLCLMRIPNLLWRRPALCQSGWEIAVMCGRLKSSASVSMQPDSCPTALVDVFPYVTMVVCLLMCGFWSCQWQHKGGHDDVARSYSSRHVRRCSLVRGHGVLLCARSDRIVTTSFDTQVSLNFFDPFQIGVQKIYVRTGARDLSVARGTEVHG